MSNAVKGKMIPIWTWVGAVLGVYGLIVFSMGIYYHFRPETLTATAAYNPSLWWGLLMLVAAAVFFFIVKFLGWILKLKKEDALTPPPPPPLTKDQELLGEIRDLLKSR